MKHKTLLFAAFIALILSSCKSYYLAQDFEEQTDQHVTVAVLPFEMKYSGKIPEKLTQEDVEKISVAESKAFQIAYFNMILRSTKRGKKPIRVKIQPYNTTLANLEKNGISIKDSWTKDPKELSKITGADAVVTGRIEKFRLMSDLASYGIDLGIHIVNLLTPGTLWPWVPAGISNSKEIKSTTSLVNAEDGSTLWSIAYNVEADWRQNSDDIINSVIRKSAKRFPYRE